MARGTGRGGADLQYHNSSNSNDSSNSNRSNSNDNRDTYYRALWAGDASQTLGSWLPRSWEVASQTLGHDIGKLVPRPWDTTLGSCSPDLGTRPWEVQKMSLTHATQWNLLPRPWDTILRSYFPDIEMRF